MTKRRTQTERTSEATSGLTDAALTILALNGFSGFTLASVAEQAGYSPGLTAYHFGSKAALVHAAMDYAFEYGVRIAENTRQSDQSSLDDLLGIVDGYFQATRENPLLIRGVYVLLTEGLRSGDTTIAERVTKFSNDCRQYIKVLIEQGVSTGCIRSDIASETMTTLFSALLIGVQHVSITMTDDLQLPGLHAALRQMVVANFRRQTEG